jgi:hypothetical protein
MVFQEGNYIKVNSSTNKKTSAFYIKLTCNQCTVDYLIGYDGSRYGQIGSFTCKCGAIFQLNDRDGYLSPVSVFHNGEMVEEIQPFLGE